MPKKKKIKSVGAPRSKEARQKLRRWTFAAEMKLENGATHSFRLPGLVYGNSAEANQTAAELLKKFNEGATVPAGTVVIPIAHETVSPDTKRQLQGLNDAANLASKAAFILAERYRLASGSDKELVEIVNEAHEQARIELFPRLKEAHEKLEALEAAQVETEKSGTKIKIGIDAVNEALGRSS